MDQQVKDKPSMKFNYEVNLTSIFMLVQIIVIIVGSITYYNAKDAKNDKTATDTLSLRQDMNAQYLEMKNEFTEIQKSLSSMNVLIQRVDSQGSAISETRRDIITLADRINELNVLAHQLRSDLDNYIRFGTPYSTQQQPLSSPDGNNPNKRIR